MAIKRNIAQPVLLGALLAASPAALNAAPEPLVVTKLTDPDPNYLPLQAAAPSRRVTDEDSGAGARVDSAIENFGRAIGRAAIIEQQQMLTLCRSGAPANATPEQRFDYEASCRYSRH